MEGASGKRESFFQGISKEPCGAEMESSDLTCLEPLKFLSVSDEPQTSFSAACVNWAHKCCVPDSLSFISLWTLSLFLSPVGSYLPSIHVLQSTIIWFLHKTPQKLPLYPSKQTLVPIQKRFPQLSSIGWFQGSVCTRRPPCLSFSMGLVLICVLLFSHSAHISASEMASGEF